MQYLVDFEKDLAMECNIGACFEMISLGRLVFIKAFFHISDLPPVELFYTGSVFPDALFSPAH